LSELRTALVAHAARIRAMDALLAGAAPAAIAAGETSDRRRQSDAARSQNVARLAAVREKSHDDLMATLAWIRELVSMIHLAKFTGAPASRAEELVAQIAAAVEGISAVAAGQSGAEPAGENGSGSGSFFGPLQPELQMTIPPKNVPDPLARRSTAATR
jgi:hypothetical protein